MNKSYKEYMRKVKRENTCKAMFYTVIAFALFLLLSGFSLMGCFLVFPTASAHAAPTDAELMTMMRMQYENDIKTEKGRVKWHGKRISQMIDTNALINVVTYQDGKAFTNEWRDATAERVKRENLKRIKDLTNGIPARLAAARLRREAEKQAQAKEVVVEKVVGANAQDLEKGGGR